jgi:(2Fe-2S) ferredoxin
MVVYPDGIFYKKLTIDEMPALVEDHFLREHPSPRNFSIQKRPPRKRSL